LAEKLILDINKHTIIVISVIHLMTCRSRRGSPSHHVCTRRLESLHDITVSTFCDYNILLTVIIEATTHPSSGCTSIELFAQAQYVTMMIME
jgi:hypothetical protein